jgi:RTX calcium-binding nonapeptide repeat (4 copies)
MKISSHGLCLSTVRPAALLATLVCAAAAAAPGDRITRNPFPLNSSRDFAGHYVDIAMRGDGSFTIASATDRGLHVRRFNANGSPRGLEFPAADFVDHGAALAIAAAADGSFVVVWTGTSGSLLARLFDASGVPRGPAFNVGPPTIAASYPPTVAMSSDGRFVVGWAAHDGPNYQSPFFRLFDADGTPQGDARRVSAPAGMHHVGVPDVAMGATGDFVVAWVQTTDGSPPILRAKRFAANGLPIGTAFTVATSHAADANLTLLDGKRTPPAAAPDKKSGKAAKWPGDLSEHQFEIDAAADGAFVVAYTRTFANLNMTVGDVFARRYNALGAPLGGEFRVSATPLPTGLRYIALDVNAAGDFALVWVQADRGDLLTVRLYRSSGAPVTKPEGFEFSSLSPPGPVLFSNPAHIGIDDRGNFSIVWTQPSLSPGAFNPDAWGQRFAGYKDTRPSCARYIATRVGTSQGETIAGTSADDVIHAFGGNDTVSGLGGSDVICGGSGADVIFGGEGPDEIFGGNGDDVLDGGDGSDLCNGERETNADTAVQCEDTRNVP